MRRLASQRERVKGDGDQATQVIANMEVEAAELQKQADVDLGGATGAAAQRRLEASAAEAALLSGPQTAASTGELARLHAQLGLDMDAMQSRMASNAEGSRGRLKHRLAARAALRADGLVAAAAAAQAGASDAALATLTAVAGDQGETQGAIVEALARARAAEIQASQDEQALRDQAVVRLAGVMGGDVDAATLGAEREAAAAMMAHLARVSGGLDREAQGQREKLSKRLSERQARRRALADTALAMAAENAEGGAADGGDAMNEANRAALESEQELLLAEEETDMSEVTAELGTSPIAYSSMCFRASYSLLHRMWSMSAI